MNTAPEFAVGILTHGQKQLLIRQAHAQRAEAMHSLLRRLASAIRRRSLARSSSRGRVASRVSGLPDTDARTQTA